MSALHRFWFTFKNPPPFSPLKLGCGVTAYNSEDALAILDKTLFANSTPPEIDTITEEVDIQSLDENHVIPNMGVVVIRGVWFPLGYAEQTNE